MTVLMAPASRFLAYLAAGWRLPFVVQSMRFPTREDTDWHDSVMLWRRR